MRRRHSPPSRPRGSSGPDVPIIPVGLNHSGIPNSWSRPASGDGRRPSSVRLLGRCSQLSDPRDDGLLILEDLVGALAVRPGDADGGSEPSLGSNLDDKRVLPTSMSMNRRPAKSEGGSTATTALGRSRRMAPTRASTRTCRGSFLVSTAQGFHFERSPATSGCRSDNHAHISLGAVTFRAAAAVELLLPRRNSCGCRHGDTLEITNFAHHRATSHRVRDARRTEP